MIEYKYIILGAGAAGLSFAHTLLQGGENSFIVIEKEKAAGGLCRSQEVDGSPLDIGGGHILDTRRKNVLDFLFGFLPGHEWKKFKRKSTILFKNVEVDYPLESNLWQLPITEQVDFLESISQSGCNSNQAKPEKFKDWIYWKLGAKIAQEYMIPYNKKIWSIDLNRLGTYWLNKLPDASFRDSLQSCLQKGPVGKIPAHEEFYYPKKFGYGEVWDRMGLKLGEHLLKETEINLIDFDQLIVNNEFKAEKIITTIPWSVFKFNPSIPSAILSQIKNLQYTGLSIAYYPEKYNSNAQWLYIPDENVPHHRVLCRHNFQEYAKGYWTETNPKRNAPTDNWSFSNEFAYPLNTLKKPESIKEIMKWAEAKSVYGLGRWGEWNHMNSDVAVEKSINLARALMSNTKQS